MPEFYVKGWYKEGNVQVSFEGKLTYEPEEYMIHGIVEDRWGKSTLLGFFHKADKEFDPRIYQCLRLIKLYHPHTAGAGGIWLSFWKEGTDLKGVWEGKWVFGNSFPEKHEGVETRIELAPV